MRIGLFSAIMIAAAMTASAGNSPYIARVYDYMPGPSQFVNVYPAYKPGYTQRRRGQCHIRKSSWRLPISIPLPTYREAKSKTKQGGIAIGRFPHYL